MGRVSFCHERCHHTACSAALKYKEKEKKIHKKKKNKISTALKLI